MKNTRDLPNEEGRFRTRDGLSLWYRVSGRGPPLLVPTPGWGPSVDMYMKSLTPLEKDFSLIYLDTRGAGRSDPPAKSSGYAFANFLDDLERLRGHLGLNQWMIFGHSAASSQAMAYAIEHPKICRGLFIIGGTLNWDDRELNADKRARMNKLSREPWFAAADEASDSDPESDDEFRKSFLGIQLPLYFASYDAAAKARHYFSASTYHVGALKYHAPAFRPKQLAEIRAPTAVFVGDHDVITTPLEAIRLERGIANSTLFMIRNAGHFPWLDQRKAFFREFGQATRVMLGK